MSDTNHIQRTSTGSANANFFPEQYARSRPRATLKADSLQKESRKCGFMARLFPFHRCWPAGRGPAAASSITTSRLFRVRRKKYSEFIVPMFVIGQNKITDCSFSICTPEHWAQWKFSRNRCLMASSQFLGKNKGRQKRIRNSNDYRSTARAEYKRAVEKEFGSQGAASSVKRIDPATGKVIEIINQRSGVARR